MSSHYPVACRHIHWLMASLMIAQLVGGFSLSYLPNSWKGMAYNYHKILGLTLLALLIARISLRVVYRAQLPKEVAHQPWQGFVARMNHQALYLAMFVIPLSGWLMSVYAKRLPKLWGLALGPVVDKSSEAISIYRAIHNNGVIIFSVLITLHVLAVIVHRLVWKENILDRMWVRR